MISENITLYRKKLIDSIIHNGNSDSGDDDSGDDDSGDNESGDDDSISDASYESRNEYEDDYYNDHIVDLLKPLKIEKSSFGKNQYDYLEDNVLSQIFGEFSDSPNSEFTIFVCPFVINFDCGIPFLKYAMTIDKHTSKMSFEHSQFQLPSFPENQFLSASNIKNDGKYYEDDESESQSQVFFMNHCISLLLTLFPVQDIINSNMVKQMYKGFIEVKDSKDIFVFFDCSHIQYTYIHRTLPNNTEWMIIEEIIFGNNRVVPEVKRLFSENSILEHIRDTSKNNIINPSEFYPCIQNEDRSYSNIYNMENDTNHIHLINSPALDLPFFGNSHVFSIKPILTIGETSTIGKLRRCAVFMKNSKHIVKNAIENLEPNEITEFVNRIQDLDVMSIYFYTNGCQYWAIKSPVGFTQI